jgi:hypothetical protein
MELYSRNKSASVFQLAIKDADVILNIKLVKEVDGGVTLLQSHYVKKVLSRFDYSDLNPLQHLMMLV